MVRYEKPSKDAVMQIVLCPGMHPPQLTDRFITSVPIPSPLVIDSDRTPVYSPHHILPHLPTSPILFIAFSAGVVGAIGAARLYHQQGGTVRGLIAIDGWGVPLFGDFPIHRMSHDRFTDWSSALLGSGKENFYANPAVEHLTMWSAPDTVLGIGAEGKSIVAAQFIAELIERYGCDR